MLDDFDGCRQGRLFIAHHSHQGISLVGFWSNIAHELEITKYSDRLLQFFFQISKSKMLLCSPSLIINVLLGVCDSPRRPTDIGSCLWNARNRWRLNCGTARPLSMLLQFRWQIYQFDVEQLLMPVIVTLWRWPCYYIHDPVFLRRHASSKAWIRRPMSAVLTSSQPLREMFWWSTLPLPRTETSLSLSDIKLHTQNDEPLE